MDKNFPSQIPIFPLSGVIYFPNTNLPLNIFEPRYLDLVNDCMKTNKLMGMVQSKRSNGKIYDIGCLGKISDFRKNNDGRILINLTGITRFEIIKELTNDKKYREFKVQYDKFTIDVKNKETNIASSEDVESLFEKTKSFFKRHGILLNWKELKKLEHDQQINTLAMIAPVSNEEKQKLLETITISEKSKTLTKIIEFYLHDKNFNDLTIQ